jgi:hypothetical protein
LTADPLNDGCVERAHHASTSAEAGTTRPRGPGLYPAMVSIVSKTSDTWASRALPGNQFKSQLQHAFELLDIDNDLRALAI